MVKYHFDKVVLHEITISFVGEDDAKVYTVDDETYSQLKRAFEYDLANWVTFQPYAVISEVSINKRNVKRVVW